MFKTDWTSDDYYNFYELNKVETICIIVADLVSFFRGIALDLETVTDRDMCSIEFADSLNRIENNIKILAEELNNPSGIIEPKTYWWYNMPFGYTDANRLEHNLKRLFEYVRGNIGYIQHCGMYTCGEEVV